MRSAVLPFLVASLAWTFVWWALAWNDIPLASEYSFFPLWLGFIAVVNAAGEFLYDDSLRKRLGWSFLWLFAVSVPLWWLFEYLNVYLQNWYYVFPNPISPLHYAIVATIDFSTVVPAVLSLAFFFERMFVRRGVGTWKKVRVSRARLAMWAVTGAVLLCGMVVFPRYLFPFAWIAPFLVLEPLLYISGFPSLLRRIERGDWSLAFSVMLAALITGFFWELWNFYSNPKWIYEVPFFDFWHVFEMPLLGFGGYPVFGVVVLSFTLLVLSVIGKRALIRTVGWDA